MAKTGSFDLNFPGARMICDSPQKRESLLKYINGESDTYEVALSYNMDQDVQKAIYNTTYAHESKHFHDHLLCPYLLHNYTLKIVALYYSILAINEWNNGKKVYKCIPIPFVSWLKMPLKDKLELLKKKGLNKKDVPFFSFRDAMLISIGKKNCKDKFTEYLLSGAAHYAEYIDNSKQISPEGEISKFSLKSFTESMAYVQHLTEIILRYGNDYGGKLNQKILSFSFGLDGNSRSESFIHSEYTAAFSMAARLAKDGGVAYKYYYPFQSYVLFWSLCGVLEDLSLTCVYPRNRLEGLYHINASIQSLELNNDDVIKNLFIHPFETFEKWDNLVTPLYNGSNRKMLKQLNNYKINVSLRRKTFKDYYDGHIQAFIAIQNKLESIGLFFPSFYVYNIADSLLYMSNIFCEEPGRYLYPEEFSKNLRNFSNVPYMFEFQNVEPIREDECTKKRKGISLMNDCVYGDSLVSDNIGFYNKKMDYRAYESAKVYLDYADALYGSSNINMPGALIKEFLPGIRPWFFNNSNN